MISHFRLMAAVCLVSMSAAAPVVAQTAQKLQEVTIALPAPSLTGGTARIAKELGLFEKHGLDAKLPVMESGSAAVTALLSGSVEFMVCSTGDLIAAKARGQDIVALLNVYKGLGGSLVMSKAVADKLGVPLTAPAKDRLKALDGLLIGTPSATSVVTIALKRAAEAAGANIRFAYVAQPAFAAALDSGAIQGHIGGAPFWARPVVKGTGVVWLSDPKGDFPQEFMPNGAGYLGTMRPTADSKRELTQKIMNAFIDLGVAVEQRPNDVKAALKRLYPDLDDQTVDLLFDAEAKAWINPPITSQQMVRDIAFTKSILGADVSGFDKIDPASLVLDRK